MKIVFFLATGLCWVLRAALPVSISGTAEYDRTQNDVVVVTLANHSSTEASAVKFELSGTDADGKVVRFGHMVDFTPVLGMKRHGGVIPAVRKQELLSGGKYMVQMTTGRVLGDLNVTVFAAIYVDGKSEGDSEALDRIFAHRAEAGRWMLSLVGSAREILERSSTSDEQQRQLDTLLKKSSDQQKHELKKLVTLVQAGQRDATSAYLSLLETQAREYIKGSIRGQQ